MPTSYRFQGFSEADLRILQDELRSNLGPSAECHKTQSSCLARGNAPTHVGALHVAMDDPFHVQEVQALRAPQCDAVSPACRRAAVFRVRSETWQECSLVAEGNSELPQRAPTACTALSIQDLTAVAAPSQQPCRNAAAPLVPGDCAPMDGGAEVAAGAQLGHEHHVIIVQACALQAVVAALSHAFCRRGLQGPYRRGSGMRQHTRNQQPAVRPGR